LPANSRDTELAEDHGNASRVLGGPASVGHGQLASFVYAHANRQGRSLRFLAFFRFSILRDFFGPLRIRGLILARQVRLRRKPETKHPSKFVLCTGLPAQILLQVGKSWLMR
jgi:hypothetical protein